MSGCEPAAAVTLAYRRATRQSPVYLGAVFKDAEIGSGSRADLIGA
jgi:hypothetical protein